MSSKSKKTENDIDRKKRRRKTILICVFLTAVFLMVATYAWLSTTLNVKVKFFKMTVQSDSGLFISLDGYDYSDAVEISVNSVITDLFETYPNHNNQWSAGGLWPVSTNGIKHPNTYYFDIYYGNLLRTRTYNDNGSVKRILNTHTLEEDGPNSRNVFIAFDVFLKNASGSPYSDHLYFEEGTGIYYDEELEDVRKEIMDGILNSMRIGLVRIAFAPHSTPVPTIQNLQCNNNCSQYIFEPYSKSHSALSITTAENYGITLVDGVPIPTYGIIAEGTLLEHTNGHPGSGIPLDTAHFALQKTMTEADFDDWLFELPNGVTKCRVYVWIEGQDIDSLETHSKGAGIIIGINLMKDLAGYE